ncbi:Fc.00g091620.m01.CDS01 [Cosmosporella sp. VM-42]
MTAAAAATFVAERGEDLTQGEIKTLVLLERIGGSISLVSVVLIFIAFALAPRVRNVQNTFIVFASVANVGASVASIIAFDGLERGVASALCQGQSFLFEMFMQSDPWWSLAMAFNVFLVFFFRTSPDSFRKWWWVYCLICYGGPFIIALTLLLIRDPVRGPVYGEATIWCWVDRDWDEIRIYTYYLLIWICIVGSLIFYFAVGYHVFHTRNQLRSFSTSKSREAGTAEHHQHQHPRFDLPPMPHDNFYGTVITEVQVIHSTPSSTALPDPKTAHMQSTPHVSFEDTQPRIQPASSQYFSSVTSPNTSRPKQSPLRRMRSASNAAVAKFLIEDPIKRAYLRTSFLFALSVLVTWIPSSMNRIHSWLAGESPFEFHVATAAVLPLQGLWNAVIFFITSWAALKEGYKDWRTGRVGEPIEEVERVERVERDLDDRTERGQSFLDDGDSGTMGSDVELRGMAVAPGKRSASM